MKLSVLIVNYGTAGYVRGCVESILAESIGDGPGEGIEIVVVDNFSSAEEQERVRALEAPSVRVVLVPENIGYAGGMARGLEIARGQRICFLNPDVRFLPGSLATLMEFLDGAPDVGAVTPRAWLDEERLLLHPPHRLPGFRELGLDLLRLSARPVRPWVDRQRTAFALRYWGATSPQDAEMLTGCCLLTDRRVLSLTGALDPVYPLYFEDSDWCRRVRAAGFRLVFHPGAELVHYYSVSANRELGEAFRKMHVSRDIYFRKFYGGPGLSLARRLFQLTDDRQVPADECDYEIRALGVLDAPPELELPAERPERYLVQMAGIPTFDLSVGALHGTGRFGLSETTWRHMFPTRYYLRAVDPGSCRVLSAWTFDKPETPAGNPGLNS